GGISLLQIYPLAEQIEGADRTMPTRQRPLLVTIERRRSGQELAKSLSDRVLSGRGGQKFRAHATHKIKVALGGCNLAGKQIAGAARVFAGDRARQRLDIMPRTGCRKGG